MVLAQGLTLESSTAKHDVGTKYFDPKTGAEYVYCLDSGSGSAQYKPVTIAPGTYETALLTKTNADNGYDVGVPQIAVTADYYYWCMRDSGDVDATVHVASACASEIALYTTSTAGRLDDDSTTQTLIAGIELTALAATAAASANATCKIRHPKAMAAEVRIDAADATHEAVSLIALSAASSATSAGSSAVVADSKAVQASSAGSLVLLAASSAMSTAATALLGASSAMSSVVVADSKAVQASSAGSLVLLAASSAMSSAATAQLGASSAMSSAATALLGASSAMSSAQSASSEGAQASSAASLVLLAASSAMSSAATALLGASSAMSSGVIADSKGAQASSAASLVLLAASSAMSTAAVNLSYITQYDLACSAYADSAVANSHSNAVSAAIEADPNYIGLMISTMASGISSGIGKNF